MHSAVLSASVRWAGKRGGEQRGRHDQEKKRKEKKKHRERRKKKAKRGGALLYHEKTWGIVNRFVRELSRSFPLSHHVWGIGGDNVGLI